jgi:hypothetical protein
MGVTAEDGPDGELAALALANPRFSPSMLEEAALGGAALAPNPCPLAGPLTNPFN